MKNTLTEQDIQNWGKNLLYFTAPTLAIFFGQLAAGVTFPAALAVAVLALYGAFADILNKYKAGETPPSIPVQENTKVQSDVQQTILNSNAA